MMTKKYSIHDSCSKLNINFTMEIDIKMNVLLTNFFRNSSQYF